MSAAVIIAAAGSGKRAGLYKQFVKLGRRSILERVIDKFNSLEFINQIVVALPLGKGFRHSSKKVIFVKGGKNRQESVYNALQEVGSPIVLVHDCVRPFVSKALINRVYLSAKKFGASIAAVKARDTIKVARNGTVKRTIEREIAYCAHTPQGFRLEIIKKAHQKALKDRFIGTDESQLVERIGVKVHIVRSDESNFKLTTPLDIKIAKYLTKKFKSL